MSQLLDEQHRDKLDQLRRSLADAHLYTPASPTAPASHDDATLLRFLRARKYDPAKAHKQFAATEAWRAEHDVARLYATFDPAELEAAKRFYPRWTGRRDKLGFPVYVFRLAALAGPLQKELNAVPEARRYQRIVALWEFMSGFTLPLCTALPHAPPAPIAATTSLIDLAGVSLGTMWALRRHLQQASELATAHYPETLHTIAVVNAPAFFPTVWGWIKAWFDEGTRNKVHVLGADPGPALRELIGADALPQVYGGDLPFAFEDEPVLDAPARELLRTDAVPRGPVLFDPAKGWVRPEGFVGPADGGAEGEAVKGDEAQSGGAAQGGAASNA